MNEASQGPDADGAPAPLYRRVLLKVSGEVLMGDSPYGIDMKTVDAVARSVAELAQLGVELCLVIGGGNIFRGLSTAAKGMERASADYMGMLATVMNALAMQNALEHLEKGRVVIFAAGTGNPFFTTDTAAALRAAEMGCDALLKGTSVDGVYTADPKRDPNAKRYDALTYLDVLAKDLKVMDASAISLMRENAIPIVVFSIRTPGSLLDVIAGRGVHTVITESVDAQS